MASWTRNGLLRRRPRRTDGRHGGVRCPRASRRAALDALPHVEILPGCAISYDRAMRDAAARLLSTSEIRFEEIRAKEVSDMVSCHADQPASR